MQTSILLNLTWKCGYLKVIVSIPFEHEQRLCVVKVSGLDLDLLYLYWFAEADH